MTSLAESLAKGGVSDIATSITPTNQTRQIAGQPCTVYNLKVAVPMQMGDSAMKMVMSGPQCLVKNGPGQADFAAFYRAASEKGFFLDAAQAKARPAMAKAMTDMYKQMAELGVPFATEMNIGIDAGEAGGPMAEMMKKMNNTIYDGSHVGLDRGDRGDHVRRSGGLQGQQAVTAPRPRRRRVRAVPLPVRDDDWRTRRRLTGTCRKERVVSPPIAWRSARSFCSATTISSGPSGIRPARRSVSDAPDLGAPPIHDDVEAGVPPERD